MRVIALLSLLFGFLGLMLLDGQTFTHAAMGVLFGAAAIVCGLGSARRDFAKAAYRWEGRILAGLGLVLVVVCVVRIPSAYRFQAKFNERSRRQPEADQKSRIANPQRVAKGWEPVGSETNQLPRPGASRRSP